MPKYCEKVKNKATDSGEVYHRLAEQICNVDKSRCIDEVAKSYCKDLANNERELSDCYCGILKHKKKGSK